MQHSSITPAHASAEAAASSLRANPAYQHDKAQLEAELTANLKKYYNPQHPVTSTQDALRATFPKGSVSKIEAYGLRTFTLGVTHTGTVQTAWVNGVVAYALSLGALPTANVPGFVSPSATS